MHHLKHLKILLSLLLTALISLTCVSCCWTCIISNTELSDIDTGPYKSWKNVTTITSNRTSIKIAPFNGGQIVSYAYNDDNILAPIYDQVDISYNNKKKIIKFKNVCNSKVYEPNTVLLSNTIDSSYDLEFFQKYSMLLEHGDVNISQFLGNNSEHKISLNFSNNTYLKSGGYFIVPLSVISKLPNRWSYLDSKKIKPGEKDFVHIFDDKLIFHATGANPGIATDSNSGWFVYIWKDLFFFKKFSYGARGKYPDKFTIEVTEAHGSLKVKTPSPLLSISPADSRTFTQKLGLIKLHEKVTSIDDAIKAFYSLHLPLLLER